MVKVDIQYKGKGITHLKIKGHADTAPLGKDLACAGVSAISIGGLNALEDSDSYEITVDDGLVEVVLPEKISEHDQTVLETIILQLKTIQVSYPEAIVIKERK